MGRECEQDPWRRPATTVAVLDGALVVRRANKGRGEDGQLFGFHLNDCVPNRNCIFTYGEYKKCGEGVRSRQEGGAVPVPERVHSQGQPQLNRNSDNSLFSPNHLIFYNSSFSPSPTYPALLTSFFKPSGQRDKTINQLSPYPRPKREPQGS